MLKIFLESLRGYWENITELEVWTRSLKQNPKKNFEEKPFGKFMVWVFEWVLHWHKSNMTYKGNFSFEVNLKYQYLNLMAF